MSTSALTLVMLCKQSEKWLPSALNSIILQTDKNFRFLVVYSYSTDATYRILLDNIEIIDDLVVQEDFGAFDGLLRAFHRIATPYFCLVSADDTISPNFISAIRRHLEIHPQQDIIRFSMNIYDSACNEEALASSIIEIDSGNRFSLIDALYGTTINQVMKSDLIDPNVISSTLKYGVFCDRALQIYLYFRHSRSSTISEVLYNFRRHRGSSTGNRSANTACEALSCNIRIVNDFYDTYQRNITERRIFTRWAVFSAIRILYLSLTARKLKYLKRAITVLLNHPIFAIQSIIFTSMDCPEKYRSKLKIE
jgi:glycosyltransferase involved in cell wall biosynthesis